MVEHGHRIVCAAIKLKDGRVICGVRHLDELMRHHLPVVEEFEKAQQMLAGREEGFVDNRYKFLNRNEAWGVALAAKQFNPADSGYSGIRGCLFSEDLW